MYNIYNMKYLRNYNTKTRKHKKNGGGHCSSAMCNDVDDTPDDAPIEEIRMYEILNNENAATITSTRIYGVSHLPEEINRLRSILTLDIHNCTFSRIPDTIGELTTLTTLRLTKTQITRLPATIGRLTNLTLLDIDNNKLTSLPKEISQLINLQTFFAKNNKLSKLPKEICELKYLNDLQLDNNILTSLPNEIGKLTNLSTLTLENNQLSKVPDSFRKLQFLSRLQLNNNPWKYPINIENFYHLEVNYRNNIININARIRREEPRKQAEMASLLNSLRQPLTIQNDISGNPLPKRYVSKNDRNQIGLSPDSIKQVSRYLGWDFLPEYKYRIPNYYTRRILTPAARSATYARRRKEISENLPRTVDNDNLEDTLKRMEDIDKRISSSSNAKGGRRRTRRNKK
jgi:hypothetical protein